LGVAAGVALGTMLTGGDDNPKSMSICVAFVVFGAEGVWDLEVVELFQRSPWLCTGGLLGVLLPGGGGRSGAMGIVAGVEGRLPVFWDIIATVGPREGVGETLLEPGRVFGSAPVRIKLDALFWAANERGMGAKAEGMMEGCEGLLACVGTFDGVEDDKNALKSSSSSKSVSGRVDSGLVRGWAPLGTFEPNNGMCNFEYLLSIGAGSIEAAMRLSRVLSSSISIICASKSVSKSFEVICPRLTLDISLFTVVGSSIPCLGGVGVAMTDDPALRACRPGVPFTLSRSFWIDPTMGPL